MKPIIFVDMDGVLVNLKKGLSNYLQKDLTNLELVEWNKYFYTFSEGMSDFELASFYENLPPTKECVDIWSNVKMHNPMVLTSISKRPPAMKGKILWCKKHLDLDVDRIYFTQSSSEKSGYACKNCLLIDDFDRNIKDWINAGGAAIHHVDISETLLKLHMYLKKS